MSLAASFARDGYLEPLDDLIALHGSNITDTEWGAALPYGKLGTDTTWTIPRASNLPAVTTGWVMRRDWLDAVGLPVPTTTDSFADSIRAVKTQDPGGLGPDFAVIGIDYHRLAFQIRDVITSFLDPHLIRSPRERTAYGWGLYPGNVLLAAPGFLDGLRFLNNLNADGMFPPDWPIYERHTIYQDYVLTGRIFTTGTPYISFLHGWAAARDQHPDADWIPIFPFTASDGELYSYADHVPSDALFVPSTAPPTSAINAIKYLNWHADPSIHLWMRYANPTAPDGDPAELRWYDKGNIISCGPLCVDIYAADTHATFPDYTTAIDFYIGSVSRNVVPRILSQQPPDGRVDLRWTLWHRQKEWIAEIILADPDDVESLFATAIQELNHLGMGEYIDQSRNAFDRSYPHGLPRTPAPTGERPTLRARQSSTAAASADQPDTERTETAAPEEVAPTGQPPSVPPQIESAAPDIAPVLPTDGPTQLPWPPMEPTVSHKLDPSIIGADDSPQDLTPGGINSILTRALAATGYSYRYYLRGDTGYALVTHMERFDCQDDKGATLDERRWVTADDPLRFLDIFSARFWRRILTNNPIGCYRMFLFLVVEKGFSTGDAQTWDLSDAINLANDAWSTFPREHFKNVTYEEGVECEVLIYQYVRRVNSTERVERGDADAISALRHLAHSAPALLTSTEVALGQRES